MVEPNVSLSPTTSHEPSTLGELKELPQVEHPPLDSIVWRKMDRWVIPLCLCFFLFSGLDKGNIANARVAGLQTSLDMSDSQYTMAVTVFFVVYIIAELPAALLVKHVGPEIMLPVMSTLWGVTSASQGLVTSYSGLLICRVFLGLAEGGIVPVVLLYMSSFYPRDILQTRIGAFAALSSLAGAFSGLLAAAIENMGGISNRPGWAWIFIIEGMISITFGLVSFFLLPRSPTTARFLTEKERAYVVSTLKRAGSMSEDGTKDNFHSIEVARAAKSPHVWMVGIVAFFSGTTVFGLSFFEPSIVASLGYSGNQAQLMSVPPYAITAVFCLISAVVSDRYQCRGYNAIFFAILQMIGFVTFYASTSSHVRYASICLMVTGAFCLVPIMTTWTVNNSAPHTRRATAVALYFIMTELGGILSMWIIGTLSPAPNYTAATIMYIAMSVGMVVFCVANLVYLRQENCSKAKKRETMTRDDEPEGLGDRSAWFVYSL